MAAFFVQVLMFIFVCQLIVIMFRLAFVPGVAAHAWNSFWELEDDLDEDEEYMFFHMR
tara:strand:- start:158 stop:331 length:174 start_codon:yes stop_codon:yes gene_type:complete